MKNQVLKALLTENIHPQAETALQQLGVRVKKLKKAPVGEELIESLKNVNILCARSRTSIDKKALVSSKLDCIGAFCIGVNQIDLKTACRRGIPVFNAPYGNTRSVAEMTVGLLLALSRSFFEHWTNMSQGCWKKFAKGCFELRGKTLGIIGYGHIGSQVSVLAEALGMRVLYYDIISKLPIGNAKPCWSLRNLLQESDFVTLHVPETPKTKHLIGEREIGFMKRSSQLINTSRGSVVDLFAVKKALESKHLSGAAIDVFPQEPQTSLADFYSPLRKMKNALLTPHIGGSTEEAQISIVFEVLKSLKDFLQTGAIQGSVNFPSLLAPPIPENVTRISHIHKNQPGVLSAINKLVSEFKVNIKTQYLATNDLIGYLIMDLEEKNVKELAQKLSQLKVSVKTRVISNPAIRLKNSQG